MADYFQGSRQPDPIILSRRRGMLALSPREGSRPRHGAGGDQRLQSRQVMGQGRHDAVVRRRTLLPQGRGIKVGHPQPGRMASGVRAVKVVLSE